jgi:hypothetical protein
MKILGNIFSRRSLFSVVNAVAIMAAIEFVVWIHGADYYDELHPPMSVSLAGWPTRFSGNFSDTRPLVFYTPQGQRVRPNMWWSSSTLDPENGFIHIFTNFMGMRTRYTESDDVDVLVLGDRSTFAPRNYSEKTFPDLLDKLLGKDVRVANAAGLDVGWDDYPAMLRQALEVWHPKTLIIAISFDDYMPPRKGVQYSNADPWTGLQSIGHLLDWVSNIQTA